MTDKWTEQQLEQFVRVRDGFIKTGFARDVAESQAARAIEARRRRPERPAADPSNPTKDELYQEAKRYNIAGRSKMDKEQLHNAVCGHRIANRGH